MTLESPHLSATVAATHASIAELIPRLVGAENPFAIVSADEMTYAQVLWTPSGFSFDYQTGRIDQHYRTVRDDLTVDETIAALNSYAAGAPIWAPGLEFERIELRSIWYRIGYRIGYARGRVIQHWRSVLG